MGIAGLDRCLSKYCDHAVVPRMNSCRKDYMVDSRDGGNIRGIVVELIGELEHIRMAAHNQIHSVDAITELATIVRGMAPRRVLIIDSSNDTVLHIMLRVLDGHTKVIHIPSHSYTGKVPVSPTSRVGGITPIYKDSRSRHTINRVRATLDGRRLDVLFIDGRHSNAKLSSDFNTYSQMVRSGGMVAIYGVTSNHDSWDTLGAQYERDVIPGAESTVLDPMVPCTAHGIGIVHM